MEGAMKTPIIGIVSKNLTVKDFFGWQWQRICDSIRYAINKNGGLVIGILPQKNNQTFNQEDEHENIELTQFEQERLLQTLKLCDGIILQGGLTSHNYEEFIAKYCYDNNIPCLGICAGFNNIVRALGGNTIKLINVDKHDRPDLQYAHSCNIIDKASLFYKIIKQDTFFVNSVHTYIANKIPASLSVVATSDDEQVEVVEAKNKKFYIGIKYHPELLIDKDDFENNIFKTFIDKCK